MIFNKKYLVKFIMSILSKQEIADSIPYICELLTYVSHMSTLIFSWRRGVIYNVCGGFTWRVSAPYPKFCRNDLRDP